MKKTVYKSENFKISKWSGGNTRQLAIYPEDAEYLDRDFLWRLSSADSELEESSFTKLPDYDRILMVLDGEVVLAHGDERSISLKAMEQDSFDGAVKTKCFGKLKRDYNLIMRKGCRGRMEAFEAESEAKAMKLSEGERSSYGIFCIDGYAVVSVDGMTDMVKADQQMVIVCDPDERIQISVMGEGRYIFTEVISDGVLTEFDVSGEKSGKAEKGDFALARKLFLGNNKWSRIMRKVSRNGMLMSPALIKKLAVLDKFYVTGIVWIIGVIACLSLIFTGVSNLTVALVTIIFTAVDIFLISPLIYYIVLPKPISAHVKKSENLDAYERKLFDEQVDYDLHHDKLMYKYRDMSKEEFDGLGDFIKKLNK